MDDCDGGPRPPTTQFAAVQMSRGARSNCHHFVRDPKGRPDHATFDRGMNDLTTMGPC